MICLKLLPWTIQHNACEAGHLLIRAAPTLLVGPEHLGCWSQGVAFVKDLVRLIGKSEQIDGKMNHGNIQYVRYDKKKLVRLVCIIQKSLWKSLAKDLFNPTLQLLDAPTHINGIYVLVCIHM